MFTPQFFRFDPALIENGTWASLPLASKAIFYPLAAHANRNGHAFPSEETIRRLSGYKDLGAVKAGVKGFRKTGVVKVHTRQAGPSKTKNYYMLPLPAPDARAIHLIHGEVTLPAFINLSPKGKALYLPLRYIARGPAWEDDVLYEVIDQWGYEYLHNWFLEWASDDAAYSWRPFDVIEYPNHSFTYSNLARLAGLSRNSISKALDELYAANVIWRSESGVLVRVNPDWAECYPEKSSLEAG
jgi:hypothetical protein